jgi:hypothetical protein
MNFDMNETLAEMLGAIKGAVSEDWGEVKSTAHQFATRRKERLELVAELRLDQEITQEKFLSTLEDEKDILEAELHAIAVISKAIAQQAANAAIDVLSKAVKAALSAAL